MALARAQYTPALPRITRCFALNPHVTSAGETGPGETADSFLFRFERTLGGQAGPARRQGNYSQPKSEGHAVTQAGVFAPDEQEGILLFH